MMNGHHQPYIQAAIEGEITWLASAITGERNDRLFKATRSLASLGIREGEILRYFKPEAEKLGLRRSEIYSTVKSGVKAGRGSPRNVPDAKAPRGVVPSPNMSIELPRRSTAIEGEQQPAFCVGAENGPPIPADEVRRHIYRRNGNSVRVKIKRRGGRYVNWYRVTVVEDPDDEGRRLFLSVKNNIAPSQAGLAFRLEQREIAPEIVGSAVAWDENAIVELTADQVLSGTASQPSTKSDAVEFLLNLLAIGPMAVRDIEEQAVDAGLLGEGKPISQSKPFRLARIELGIKPRRAGGLGGGGRWVWELPGTKMPPDPYDAPVSDEGTLASEGHLSDADRKR